MGYPGLGVCAFDNLPRVLSTIGVTVRGAISGSAQEHAGHLLDLEPLWLMRVGDYVAASVQLTVADLKNRKTDEANHNAHPLEQILTAFRAARERLLKRVDELDPPLFARTIPHPRLKTPMRLVDHLYFVAEHDDHHLARIWELVNVVR
jgi:uncharacterized damage-inducible protein DinB